MSINQRLGTGTTAVSGGRSRHERLASIPDAINFGGGDPDFNTPEPIQKAALEAMASGRTHYAPTQGLPELREAVAGRYARKYGAPVDPSMVLVTSGGANAVFLAIHSAVGEGDTVVVQQPALSFFSHLVRLAGAQPIPVGPLGPSGPVDPLNPLGPPGGRRFSVNLEGIERAVRESAARMIVVNFPNNPSGAVLAPAEYRALVEIARSSGAFLVSDEVYDEICFEGSVDNSMAQFLGSYDRIIVVNSFSKTFAMTGWRLGYAISSPEQTARMTRLFSLSVSHINTPVQWAGLAAVLEASEYTRRMVADYAVRARMLAEGLNRIEGVSAEVPPAALYVFADVSGTGVEPADFCNRLFESRHVLCYPGPDFGLGGEGRIRMSFAGANQAQVSDGTTRIAGFVSALRGGR